MNSEFSCKREIQWDCATIEEKKKFLQIMPEDMVEALTEFRKRFSAQVITISISVKVSQL